MRKLIAVAVLAMMTGILKAESYRDIDGETITNHVSTIALVADTWPVQKTGWIVTWNEYELVRAKPLKIAKIPFITIDSHVEQYVMTVDISTHAVFVANKDDAKTLCRSILPGESFNVRVVEVKK